MNIEAPPDSITVLSVLDSYKLATFDNQTLYSRILSNLATPEADIAGIMQTSEATSSQPKRVIMTESEPIMAVTDSSASSPSLSHFGVRSCNYHGANSYIATVSAPISTKVLITATVTVPASTTLRCQSLHLLQSRLLQLSQCQLLHLLQYRFL